MAAKKMLVPQQSKGGTYKSMAGIVAVLFAVYFIISSVPGVTSGGEYSSYFGKSYYSKNVAEYEFPNRVMHYKYDGPKEKACLVLITRNIDAYDVLNTIKSVEDRFNGHYNYDWVFMNDQPFSEEFIYIVGEMASGRVRFATIPEEQWSFPESVDRKKSAEARKDMLDKYVPLSGFLNYRHLWRFNVGFFHTNPIFDDYEYYWNIETDMKLVCDVNYDVFKFMKDNGKKYGFLNGRRTFSFGVETLWKNTAEFLKLFPNYLAKDNGMPYVSDDNGASYNLCGFDAGNEIGAFSFFRSEAYQNYFKFMDKFNGWYYERWSDSDFRAITTSLFLNKNEVHHFEDLGYYHILGEYEKEIVCPLDKNIRLENKCGCDSSANMNWFSKSCLPKYYDMVGRVKPPKWKALQSV